MSSQFNPNTAKPADQEEGMKPAEAPKTQAFDPSTAQEVDMARGFTGMARDAAAWAVKGAIAVPEAAVGVADMLTGGRVGKALENEGGAVGFRPKQAKEMVNDWHSDATKEAQRKFQEADGIVDKAAVVVTHPSLVVGAVAESLPSMGAGGVAARGALAAAQAGKLGAKAAAGANTAKGAALAGAAGEGVMMAGSQASSIRQETEDGLLTPSQAGAAAATGLVGGAFGFGGAKLANKLGVGDADTMLAQGTAGIAKQNADEVAAAAALMSQKAKSIPRQVVEGAIAEGFLEELPQSVAETVIKNLALDKPWSEGLDEAIVMGVLSGGAMGGAAAGYKGFTTPSARNDGQPAPESEQAPVNPGVQRMREALALPAPTITVNSDGQAMTAADRNARLQRINAGDVTDITPVRETLRPSEAMGLDPNAGGLTGAAALAVDSGAHSAMQPLQFIDPDDMPDAGSDEPAAPLTAASGLRSDIPTFDYENASPQDRARYEADIDAEAEAWEMARSDLDAEAFASINELDDSDIPFFDQASNVSDEDFLRALGASDEEISHAIEASNQPRGTQSGAGSNAQAQANEPRGARQSAGQDQSGGLDGQPAKQTKQAPQAGTEASQGVNGNAAPSPSFAEPGKQGAGQGGDIAADSRNAGAHTAADRIATLTRQAEAADAEARDWASRDYKHNPKPLPAHAATGGPADVSEANEQRRLKAIADAKGRASTLRAEAEALREQGNAAAQEATKPSTPALAAISRKQIPDMTDAELVALTNATSANHTRYEKMQKAMQARGLQAPDAINEGVKTDDTQPPEAQQAQPQQQEARAAAGQAVDGVPAGAAAQTADAAAQAELNPTQASIAAIAQEGNARRAAEKQRKLEASERWMRMTTAERQAAAQKATGLNAIQRKNVHTKPWADLSEAVRAKLLDVVAPIATENKASSDDQQRKVGGKAGESNVQKAQDAIKTDAVTQAAAQAATNPANDTPEPTEAQKEAGNYKKGHLRLHGLDIAIENPAGTKRNPAWPALKNHYGYFKGSVGADKDHVDVFLTDKADDASLPVFVVDQNNRDGSFDEHKVIMGAANEAEARATYLQNYEKGWTGLGAITGMSLEDFKGWVMDASKTKKPAAQGMRMGRTELKPDFMTEAEDAQYKAERGLHVDGMDSPDQVRAELQNLADKPITKETNDAGTSVHGAGTSPLEPVATPNDQGTSRRGDAGSPRADGQQGSGQASGATDDAGNAEARSRGNSAASNDPVQAGTRSGRGRSRVSAPDASKRKRAPKTPATSQELQAEAAEEIKHASPVNVPGIDFTITNEVELGKGTEGVKYADNLKAIRTLKQIEQENRRATPEEQRTLARYVGWGGLKNAFRVAGASKEGDDGIANGWKARVDELEALLTPAELRAARNSTTAAHFTSETVVGGVWKAVQRLGFNGGAVLEPSVGTGNFLGLMPQSLRGKSKVFAVEYDSLTARMAQQLYPNQTILHTGFQNVPLPNGKFALAIGNPPFGKESLYFKHNPLLQGKSIHNQFFMQSLQSLADGGVMGMVVSHNLMDAQDQAARLTMAVEAEFVGAIRLPETAFKENARTDVVTDMLFFKKRSLSDVRLATVAATKLRNGKLDTKALENLSAGMPDAVASNQARVQAIIANMEQWVPSSKQANFAGSGETVSLNPYFLHNPKMVLGTMDASGTMNGRPDLNVRLDNPADMARLMEEAIAQLPQTSPVDTVAERTLEQFDQMATAMRLAVNRAEPGAVTRTPDGVLKIVVEMDDVNSDNRKALLSELTLTANTPFSEDYTLRSDGKWQRQEDVLGEDGKPVKKVSKLGKVTNQNEKKITVYDNLANIPVKDKWGSKRIELITDMLPLRDGFKRQMMLEASDAPTKMMEAHRQRLADLYQGFVKKHGKLHKRDTEQVAMVMPDGALVLALENVAQDGSTSPADILSRRVTVPPKPVERVTNASEAVAVVLAETGSIDIERVAKLLGTDEEGAKAALSAGDKPRAFFDPETNQWEPSDGYLSGLVRRKLLAAKAAGLDANVRALEAVQPEPWDASQITPAIGSSWIPAQVYADFLKRLGFTSATVHYSQATNTFSVATKGQAAPDWRASDNALSTVEIVQRLLNSRAMKVLRVDADKKTYVDQEATAESQMKAGEIANEFLDWAFADDDRREQLVTIFNEKYNTRVQRQRDGSHLTLPGKVPDSVIKMRPWQLNAVWRGITDNAVLYDHAVGAGKTFTAIARAMERRRMDLSKKPMIVVPNHLVEQWAADVRKLYPGANILAGTKHDFEKQRRRRLFARIGAGDYDMVIVGHSSFGFIDIDPATEERYLDEELRIAYDAVKEAEEAAERDGFTGWGKPMGVAQAERLVKKLEERLAKIRDTKRDRLLTFEEMGIDDLTVDEAHEFKNLAYSSNLSGVSGMGNKTGSQKALDLNLKIRTLKEKQGTSVAFLTGTPISNSVAEMYLVLRNLMPAEMAELGFENFDAWRTNYVSATAAYEPTESGSLKEVTRLGREWSNMRSLMDLYYTVSDAVTLQDMKDDFARANPGKTFPVPKVRSQENGGGDREMVAIKPNEQQRAILRDIVNGFDSLGGITNPKDRNKERLRLMDRARKVSLDARAVDPNIAVPDGTGKIGAVVASAVKIYNQWEADKGTQLIFLDRSVPKAKGDDAVLKKYDKLVEDWNKANAKGDPQEVANIEEKLEKFDSNEINELRNAQKGGWNAYEEIKRQLVAQGIPAKEIRFVQEANTDDQKAELFRQVNAGEVRILLGSSPRMGAGTNVQERLVALHHVDVTWKPSDIEQREGRIVRQGNALLAKYGDEFTVDVIAYATEMTVDAKMWSLNATKLKSINGVRKYEGAFNMEFEDEESASMAEMAALATGNPLMVERVVLDGDIKKLEMAQRAYTRRVSGARGQMRQAQRTIEQGPVSAARLRTFAQQLETTMAGVRQRSDARKVTVNGVVFTSDLEADLAATKSIEAQQASAGKEKGRYVVEVNGEKATSRERIRDLIADQLGDKDFEAEVDGKKFISINSAVAAIMDKHGPASTRGREFTLDGITINGMRVELDIAPSRWKANTDSVLTLVVLDADGNSMVQVSHGYESPTLSAASLRAGLNKLAKEFAPELHLAQARDQEAAVERAKRDLPELKKLAEITFPQEQELKDKRERLGEVEKALAGSSDAARLDGEVKPSATEEGDAAEEVAFSRGSEFAASPRRAEAVKLTQGVVDAMRAAWSNGPEVVVAYDMQDPVIPEAVRRADLQQRSGGATGNPEGFYYQGKAYVLASQMQTTNDVARVVAHEVLGHAGLRGLYGKHLGSILDQLATMRRALVNAKIKEYGLKDDAKGRREAAEEVLANMAETTPHLGFVTRAVAAIRTWLRANVPGFQSLRVSDAEIIRDYILPARAWVERGGPDGNGPRGGQRIEPAMSRAEAASATDVTQTEAFKRWFGDSKVVDAEGKPMVMYHGTTGDFATFKPSRSAGGLIFFTENAAVAGGYADGTYSGYAGMGDAESRVNVGIAMAENPDAFDGTTLNLKATKQALVDALYATDVGEFMDIADRLNSGAITSDEAQAEFDAAYGELNRAGSIYPVYLQAQRPANTRNTPMSWKEAERKGARTFVQEGFDSVWVTEQDGLALAVFSPEQIKSAIGNNGDFDPANPDIRFSRAKMAELKDKGLQMAHTYMTHPGKVSLWDKTVGTMRHISERYPAFKPVFEAAQQFIDDVASVANQAAQYAPRLIPRVETLSDLRKKPISVVDNRAIGKALFGGTLDWGRDQHGKAMPMDELRAKYANLSIDAKAEILLAAGKVQPQVMGMWRGQKMEQFEAVINSQFESKILKAGAAFNHKELKDHFKLTDQQISLYDEARATVDKSLDITARAQMLRIVGRDYDFLRDMVMDAPTLTEAWKLLDAELEQRAKEVPDSRDQMAALMHQIAKAQGDAQSLMEHGYMPLQRFGKYTLHVQDDDGQTLYYGMFESMADSNRMKEAMQREFKGARITQGTMNEQKHKLMAGITPETAELFGSMLGLDSEGNEEKDKAFQEYLKLAKNNHSALKRLIHRKGILGYSDDVGRVLASFVYSNARLSSTGLNAGKMEQAIHTLQTEHKHEGELGEIAVKLRSYIQDPQEEGQAIRGMLFAQYLGGSLASAAVNMTQPFAVTMPWLSQFGGMTKAGRYMAGALKDMAKRGFQYEPDLARSLKQAEDDGVVSPQEIHQLMAQARGAGGLRTGDGTKRGDARATASNYWEKIKVGWGQPFALAEEFNRRSTFIAAFRLATELGNENPAEFARRAVVETQFLYTKANKPQWARGAVGGTLFTFKTYSVSFLELMHRTWNAGEPGSPERAAGRRAVGWAMVMLMLMGGAGGLPFVEDVEDVVDGMGQMMGYNLSSRQWRKELMQSVLGTELAEFIETGLSGLPGAPIDVSGRLGMGNLIPGTGLFKSKQSNTRDVVEMIGPAGDLVARGFSGAKSIASGVLNADAASVGRGAMEMMPSAVRNAAKGVDMAGSGIYKDTKGYKVVDTSLDEALWKAIGFQPRSVAQVQESNSHMMLQKSFYIQTSNDIRAQWAQALFNKDEAAVQRVRDRLAEWNENNPEQPIRIKMPDIWKRVAQMGKDRTARIADTAPTAIRQQLRGMAQEESR